jgi:hypothetical protein
MCRGTHYEAAGVGLTSVAVADDGTVYAVAIIEWLLGSRMSVIATIDVDATTLHVLTPLLPNTGIRSLCLDAAGVAYGLVTTLPDGPTVPPDVYRLYDPATPTAWPSRKSFVYLDPLPQTAGLFRDGDGTVATVIPFGVDHDPETGITTPLSALIAVTEDANAVHLRYLPGTGYTAVAAVDETHVLLLSAEGVVTLGQHAPGTIGLAATVTWETRRVGEEEQEGPQPLTATGRLWTWPDGFGLTIIRTVYDPLFGLIHLLSSRGTRLYHQRSIDHTHWSRPVRVGDGTDPDLLILPDGRIAVDSTDLSTSLPTRRLSSDEGRTWSTN